MKADEVTRIAAQLITRGGVRLSDEDLRLLESNASVLTSGQEDRADVMSTAALRGFFDAAADGDALVPLYLIQEQFGRTLEEDYPEAGEAFLRFARTYWSLKIVLDTSSESNWAHQALLYIEARIIGPLFFHFLAPLPLSRCAGNPTNVTYSASMARESTLRISFATIRYSFVIKRARKVAAVWVSLPVPSACLSS